MRNIASAGLSHKSKGKLPFVKFSSNVCGMSAVESHKVISGTSTRKWVITGCGLPTWVKLQLLHSLELEIRSQKGVQQGILLAPANTK